MSPLLSHLLSSCIWNCYCSHIPSPPLLDTWKDSVSWLFIVRKDHMTNSGQWAVEKCACGLWGHTAFTAGAWCPLEAGPLASVKVLCPLLPLFTKPKQPAFIGQLSLKRHGPLYKWELNFSGVNLKSFRSCPLMQVIHSHLINVGAPLKNSKPNFQPLSTPPPPRSVFLGPYFPEVFPVLST